MDTKYTIFIFFEKENFPKAQKLKEKLASNDICVVFADDTFADEMTAGDFEVAAKGAYAFVFLLTPESLKKDFLEEEIGFAVQNEKIIIPVMLEDFELEGAVAHQLSNVQRVDAFSNGEDETLEKVAKQLTKRIQEQKTQSYSIGGFLFKKAVYELGKLWNKAKIKLKEKKEDFLRFKTAKTAIIAAGVITAILTSCYIHIGLSSSYYWTSGEIALMSWVPLIPGALITYLMQLIFGKVKNLMFITFLVLATIALVFVGDVLTGFGISVYLQQ